MAAAIGGKEETRHEVNVSVHLSRRAPLSLALVAVTAVGTASAMLMVPRVNASVDPLGRQSVRRGLPRSAQSNIMNGEDSN